MSVDPETIRAATLAYADATIKRADAWLSKTLLEHPDSEGDPLVLLDACLDLIQEIRWRVGDGDDPQERRIRLAQHLAELETVQQLVNRARLREREGIGILSEDSRELHASSERRIAAVRIFVRDWLDAEKSTRTRRKAMSERRVLRDR